MAVYEKFLDMLRIENSNWTWKKCKQLETSKNWVLFIQGGSGTDKTSEYTQNAGCPDLTLTRDLCDKQ